MATGSSAALSSEQYLYDDAEPEKKKAKKTLICDVCKLGPEDCILKVGFGVGFGKAETQLMLFFLRLYVNQGRNAACLAFF